MKEIAKRLLSLVIVLACFLSLCLPALADGEVQAQDEGTTQTQDETSEESTGGLLDQAALAALKNYTYDDYAQEEYYATKYGQTRMYFYMNGERYVLCDQVGDCKTYTYDRLVDMGATIINQDRVILNNGDGPGVAGDTYYYNSSYEQTTTPGDSGHTTSGNNDTELVDETGYCTKLKEPLQFIGNLVLIFKIVIPIIIILFGMIDFFKAITGAKDEEIKKSARSLLMRVLAGVIIFFIPTIVSTIFSLVSDFAKIEGSFDACQKCVFNVRECK